MKTAERRTFAASPIVCGIAAFTVSTSASLAWEAATFDRMMPAYCFAGNTTEDPEAPGGYARCDNMPKVFDRAGSSFREGAYIEIVGPSKEPFAGEFEGLEIRLVNNSKEQIVLPASDSRIQLVQEARAEDGTWKPLEFFPGSWCGNSHHNVYLDHGHYFTFTAPKYSGPFKTRLRFRAVAATAETVETPVGKMPSHRRVVVYSEEFEGSIDTAQFERKEDRRSSRGIMDPYGE